MFNYPIGKGGMPEKKAAKAPAAVAEHEEPDGNETAPHHAAIHEHLQNMHAQTGEAHSHVEHHGDGTHTSHHISASGEESGPHSHENLEALKSHMDQFLSEEEKEGGDWDKEGE